jgi:hypothetical protein
VPAKEFFSRSVDRSAVALPVEENWLYRTRAKPVVRPPNKEAGDVSEDCPQWFNVKDTPIVKNHDISKSQGFDGTVTVLSRITGWITVSPRSRNRQKRLGRYGPFDKEKKGANFQNVSDLAPAWMQGEGKRQQEKEYVDLIAHPCVRGEKKRMISVEKKQPVRSVFSFGDFRHNVLTKEEAEKNAKGLVEEVRRPFEWKEEAEGRRGQKAVTGKIGCLY